MTADLKGVNNFLVNPDIFSAVAEFVEHEDKACVGMNAVLRNHECNDYCKRLGLTETEAQKDRTHDVRIQTDFDLSKIYIMSKKVLLRKCQRP